MLIIVEGPDGSGKTTLVERIRKQIHPYLWVLKSNSKPGHVVKMTQVLEWIRHKPVSIPVICDRYPLISEMVYGPIIRGACLHHFSLEQVAAYIHGNKPVMIIYCRPPLGKIQEGAERNEQMQGVMTYLTKLTKGYDSVMHGLANMEEHALNVVEFDHTDDVGLQESRIIQQVSEFIERERPHDRGEEVPTGSGTT